MLRYILKRILIFIPTLVAISLLAFGISVNSPGDPVEQMNSGDVPSTSVRASEQDYLRMRQKLGLDLPIFYFGLNSFAIPDTLYKVIRPADQEVMEALTYEFGNWEKVSQYYYSLKELEYTLTETKPDSASRRDRLTIRNHVSQVKNSHDQPEVQFHLDAIDSLVHLHPVALRPVLLKSDRVRAQWEDLLNHQQIWKIYIPAIHFYGIHNQYHRWISHMLTGDFGVSYQDKREISNKIPEALRWTLFINIFSLILAYLFSIPIGIRSAVKKDTLSDKTITTGLFILYSLPTFWVATLMIQFLCNPDYLNIFPTHGVQNLQHSAEWSIFRRIGDWTAHLFLPMVCSTYGAVAVLSRYMRVGMLEVLGQDYIRTARAKGLGERLVIYRHALKNSLIPMITLLGNLLPGLVAGSLIIEIIFSVPGMGLSIYSAIVYRDYPMIIAFFTLFGALTQMGILVSDLLYALMDPRISYSKS
ncbi:MAG: ABC transporter permease [Bacteroidia bacterium]|nr:ABC transporter permease [Bacteroidia bacterium]